MAEKTKLGLIWVTADRESALHMIFMYGHNSKKLAWWDKVRLIVWGPSAKLLSEDEELQTKVQQMAADGVQVWACKACADQYGVSETLEKIGIRVTYVGEPVTKMLQSGWKVLSI